MLFVQPLRLFFKVRKVKQHPFQGIASVIQLDHNAFVCGGTDALAPVPFSPKGLTGQNPPKIDGFSVPAAGGDQAELVVLFGILQIFRHDVQMCAGLPAVFYINTERIPLFDRVQYPMEDLYVYLIFKWVAVRIPVKNVNVVRREQRRHILKAGTVKIKQADARVKRNRLQPPLLQHRKRHGRRMEEGRCAVRPEQLPFFARERRFDG